MFTAHPQVLGDLQHIRTEVITASRNDMKRSTRDCGPNPTDEEADVSVTGGKPRRSVPESRRSSAMRQCRYAPPITNSRTCTSDRIPLRFAASDFRRSHASRNPSASY